MPAAFILCIALTAGYIALIGAYRLGWSQQKKFVLPPHFSPSVFISVIIPARNEQQNIGACIESVLAQVYPLGLMEIIVVDDHSYDDTADIVNEYAEYNVRCLDLAAHLDYDKPTTAFKKAALAAGIAQAKGDLIVTTDADCTAPNAWLMHIAALYELQQPDMVVAPVIYRTNSSILQVFQLIDFMSMQGITAAAHRLKLGNMSNGANLAFRKTAYDAVDGYKGTDHLASGDDYLLTMKIGKAAPGTIAYLKSAQAIVTTTPQYSWIDFLQQRIRWASKSGKYSDYKLTMILLLVYMFNVAIVAAAVGGYYQPAYYYMAIAMIIIKTIAEYLFLLPVAHFFRRRWVLWYFPFLQPLHIVYIVLAGFLGLIGGYKWKGRRVR
jgi:cellulose synthase/poly-beta-1,6-N-acetylglucosamine synthase-like glycosyltransferase